MQRLWSADELGERWSLLPEDLALLAGRVDAGKFGFAVQLAFWRQHGRFPDEEADVAPAVVAHLAAQIGVGTDALDGYAWAGRSGRRHRVAIIDHLAVAVFDEAAEDRFRRWLAEDALPREFAAPALDEELSAWFARSRVTRPGAYRLGRILRSAQAAHDDAALQRVSDCLDAGMRDRLGALLADEGDGTAYARLAADPGRVGLESLLAEIAKLERLRALALPSDLLRGLHPDQAKRFRRRAAVESAWELRRHPERIRLPLLAFWCAPREAEVVDGLVELLIQVTHRITVKAERRVVDELVEEAREVRGKAGILFRVVEAASGSPEGVVREVIFPVIGEGTFDALVREARALGTPQSRRVHTAVRASYGSYYRRMMPKLLAALEFRSNNGTHRPLLDALDAIRRAEGEGRQFFKADEVTIEGVIRPKWRDIVLEDVPGGGQRVNRINYEICVLQTLRERLRCKEVWVVGAGRFRNPDADLPADFAERRAECYERLGLPTEARAFMDALRAEMTEALGQLNRGMPRNPGVRLDPRRRHPIVVTPLEPQPEPLGLSAIKAELGRRWSGTGLLDVFKETDLRIGFTDAFATAASREATDRDEVRRRLLLCLYGLGTNAGLKRLAGGGNGYSYKELLHTHRRYIDAEAVRDAARRVANATLAVRDPRIWGEGTTACASDSKHFGAFDQNLMTEWHVRYGGRGVMIYWHVERGSVCIHSRLRRCSSSEVAAMIEGVLRHDTEMEVERQYVDSHGQSEVAFAFTKLLGFQLLPRLKAISAQRLYLPEAGGAAYPNLACILARQIDWALVEQQYDEFVRYATAMAERTADPEAILRRFTRGNVQHPTYKALAELGKAVKTVFLYVTWNLTRPAVFRRRREHVVIRFVARSLASPGRRAAGARVVKHAGQPWPGPPHDRLRNRTMLALGYDAGLRREELCSLRTDDIDPGHRLLRIRAETTKNRRERVVPYSAVSGELLRAYLVHRAGISRARGPLFLSESRRNHAEPLTSWTWSKVIRRIALVSGVPRFGTHTLRHLCLTDLARAGWELHAIATFAGHRHPATTLQYIHLSGRELADKLARGMAQIHDWRVAMLAEIEPAGHA